MDHHAAVGSIVQAIYYGIFVSQDFDEHKFMSDDKFMHM